LPAFKQKILETARGLRSSLSSSESDQDQARRLQQAERQLETQRAQISKQKAQLEKQSQELKELRAKVSESVHGAEPVGISPENVIWILGYARTGSTWLAFMMEEIEGYTVWREPYVGVLFGRLYYDWVGEKHFETKHFILGRHYKESWLKSVRYFVLHEASVRFPRVADGGYLVIKEPNGSIGAPLLMEALPESRMILLVRDPRDVMASRLDSTRKGSWLYERRVEQGGRRTAMFEMEENNLVESTASAYLRSVGNSKQAYDAHRGPKVLVRYEDLRSDTLGTMKRIYSSLRVPVGERELSEAVKKHSWENVPEEEKGPGKFHRKGTPGSWREDLAPRHIEMVERITSPLLKEFYPDER